MQSYVEAARRHLRLLESLFEDPGIQSLRGRHPAHPAVKIYDAVSKYLDGLPQIAYESLQEIIPAVARLEMDLLTWGADGQYPSSLEDLIPDESARRVIASRLPDPSQYSHMMSEVFVWKLLRLRGWDVELLESDSHPDIRIKSPDQLWAEVKTISEGTPATRIPRVIEKANGQIKKADGRSAGILYVIVQREGGRAQIGDKIPNDVAPYVAAASRKLGSKTCRSVGAVVFFWDDLRVTTTAVPENLTLYFSSRRSHVVRHPTPRSEVPSQTLPEDLGLTMLLGVTTPKARDPVRTDPFSTRVNNIDVSDVLRPINEFRNGLIPGHLVDILKEPDSSARPLLPDDLDIVLAVRRVKRRDVDSVVVLSASALEDKLLIFSALQLFGTPAELDTWSQDPLLAFDVALGRYGIPLRLNAEEKLLFEYATIEAGGTLTTSDNDPAQLLLAHFVSRNTPFGPLTVLVWAHAIDLSLYESAVEEAYGAGSAR
jgi:hypothetical protein